MIFDKMHNAEIGSYNTGVQNLRWTGNSEEVVNKKQI